MWQTLETKARFIQQVMNGENLGAPGRGSRRRRAHLRRDQGHRLGQSRRDGKVKIDTEIRKLDQLRAAHVNQQHNIRWEIRDLPRQIAEAKQHLAKSKPTSQRETQTIPPSSV